ncbi:phospholipase C [Bradyrhizobium sp. SYSU BS000235]|uniref:phospholipase C n=1 Tax=Bradyrhizobium sp. SYSU BS000235 TaxID=3411332 RepID=UPI003C70D78F
MKKILLSTVAIIAVAAGVSGSLAAKNDTQVSPQNAAKTATPIKHLVVIFGENRSYDHYFGTYPHATNPQGEPAFQGAANTPKSNNFIANPTLLSMNGNSSPALNGSDAANPFRLDRSQANTQSQNHAYTAEQQAYDNGKADLFPKFTGRGTSGSAGAFGTKGQVMGYFDGNTVTAMWNYAQKFAMSDNAYTDGYGPSTNGAINVISGQTNGVQFIVGSSPSNVIADGAGGQTLIGDIDPGFDVCSSKTTAGILTGKNIGDLLNAANLTWGSFMGGFSLVAKNANGTTDCKRSTFNAVTGSSPADYIPHHAWFQYYVSTANPTHARPGSIEAVGYTKLNGAVDPANHGYDLQDFYDAVKAGNFPSVSYIKMPAYQDAHAGNSDPLNEQFGNVELINFLQQQPDWESTAVIITYDDSDGWYDHAYATPTTASYDATADQVNGPGQCGRGINQQPLPMGVNGKPVNGRCGPGTRVPFIVISPFAKQNYISHARISQASVVRFIEDNWLNGRRIGAGSLDAQAGSILDMFDFQNGNGHRAPVLTLDPSTGVETAAANNGLARGH